MSDLRETPQFKLGEAGEEIAAAELRVRGCFVLRAADFRGKDNHPPCLEGPNGKKHKMPDLLVFKPDAFIRWVEVKTKTKNCEGKISGEREQGIDAELVDEYRAIQDLTGLPVWLVIYEQNNGELLIQKLDKLGPGRRSDGSKANGEDMGPMIYWLRSQFEPLELMGGLR